MSSQPPANWRVARANAVPDSAPVALAVAGADALYSISLIAGGAFIAGYKAVGGGPAGAIAGMVTLPITFFGLWAFGRWYQGDVEKKP